MLTGRDTVPAAFAATAWREGWIDLATRVRHLALGLGDAPGTVPVPTTAAGALAVLAAGGVLDHDVDPAPLDEDALVARGREVDERDPGAHERRWREIRPGDVAARGDGGREWTHGALLWGARSVAQHVAAGPGDRIRLDDPLDGVRRLVLEVLVPAVSGATLSAVDPDVLVVAGDDLVDRVRPVIDDLSASTRSALGLHRCRLALVTGDAGVAVDWLGLLGIPAAPLEVVPGCAAPIRAGTPLPGVTIVTDDDGRVRVRADALARDVDGWLEVGARAR